VKERADEASFAVSGQRHPSAWGPCRRAPPAVLRALEIGPGLRTAGL